MATVSACDVQVNRKSPVKISAISSRFIKGILFISNVISFRLLAAAAAAAALFIS